MKPLKHITECTKEELIELLFEIRAKSETQLEHEIDRCHKLEAELAAAKALNKTLVDQINNLQAYYNRQARYESDFIYGQDGYDDR